MLDTVFDFLDREDSQISKIIFVSKIDRETEKFIDIFSKRLISFVQNGKAVYYEC